MGINSFSFYHLYHFRNLDHILVCWWWQHFDDNVDSVFMRERERECVCLHVNVCVCVLLSKVIYDFYPSCIFIALRWPSSVQVDIKVPKLIFVVWLVTVCVYVSILGFSVEFLLVIILCTLVGVGDHLIFARASVCIWHCEHALFCVECFLHVLYIFFKGTAASDSCEHSKLSWQGRGVNSCPIPFKLCIVCSVHGLVHVHNTFTSFQQHCPYGVGL